jgi:hypothetical protein
LFTNGFVEEEKFSPKSEALSTAFSSALIQDIVCEVTRIEQTFQFLCDIEWAYANNELIILQVRPITTHKQDQAISLALFERAFQFHNLPFIFIDAGFSWYARRHFLIINYDSKVGQFIEKNTMYYLLARGVELFSSHQKFSVFEKGFRVVITKLQTFIAAQKQNKNITINDIFAFSGLIIEGFYYFEKTEFFYTDACYIGEMDEITKQNLLTLGEDLKMVARPLMVELLTTIPYHFCDSLAAQFGLDSRYVRSYTLTELIALVETGTCVSADIIKHRLQPYVYYAHPHKTYFIEGEDKQKLFAQFSSLSTLDGNELRGKVAHPGFYSG